jgi:hypothetical protein
MRSPRCAAAVPSRRNAAAPGIDVAQNQAAFYKCGWDKFTGINPRFP